eukprot:403350593
MSLAQTSLVKGAKTTYLMSFVNNNKMAAGSAYSVKLPSTIWVAHSIKLCIVQVNWISYNPTMCVVDYSNQEIFISGGVTIAIDAGQVINIILEPITNPTNTRVLESIIVTSYTDGTFTYMYDANTEGLIPTFAQSFAMSQILSAVTLTVLLIGFQLGF